MAKIEINTSGIRGGAQKLETKGQVILYIDNAKPGNYIVIDAYIGQGESYQQRKDTLIQIRQDYNVIFSGTFEELQAKLSNQ